MATPTSKLGILAGSGVLPGKLAAACREIGRPYCVFAFEDAAELALLLQPPDHWVSFGRVGQLLDALHAEDCREIVMAGAVKRPDLKSIRPGVRLMALLPRVLAAARRGDGAILDVIVGFLEGEGFSVVGAEEILADLLGPRGALGQGMPGEDDWRGIIQAVSVVNALGALDVGQGAVVRDGLVLAVEAAEGTDAMLGRCREFVAARRGGVLVKLTKPGQERRVDLPTIGVSTVEAAAAAGLAGIAYEAGATLVVDREAVARAADRDGIFVWGIGLDGQRNPVHPRD